MMKLIKSFAFAWNGIKLCFVSEQNFRIHALLTLVAVVFGFVFQVSTIEWIAIGLCIGFVIAMEMLNTAIENLCDVVHKEFHPAIKRVKDISAGAVLVSSIISLIMALAVFLPKIIFWFKSVYC